MVELEVLHADVERCLVASREEAVGCPVGIHGLVGLIERCKCVTESNPASSEVLVQAVGFLEVLPGQVILADQEIVRALQSQLVREDCVSVLTTENQAIAESAFALTSL